MEGQPENQGGTAVAELTEAAAQPTAQPEAGEPGSQKLDSAQVNAGMNAFMRGAIGADGSTLKPAEADASGDSASDSSGDVEAGGEPVRGPDGRFLPRRGVPKAIEDAQSRIADLERQLADRDPAKVAEREAAEALAASDQTDAARYQHLNELPDDHPELSEGDNYSWLQEYKRVLSLSPKSAKQHRALAEQQIATANEQMAKDWEGFKETIRSEMRAIAHEFGVDPETWKTPGSTWASMTRDVAAPLKARIAELERELHSARTVGPNGLGSARAAVAAGRSSAGPPPRTMNDILRYG